MTFPRDPDHALYATLNVLAAARAEIRPSATEHERALPDADLLRWYAGPLGMPARPKRGGKIVPFPPQASALAGLRTGARQMTGRVCVDPADLADLPLFAGIAPADLSGLAARLCRVTLAPGRALMSAEQPGDLAYVILAGTLRVLLADADGNEITLALLGAGEIVGEMALIEDDVRSATVVAIEPVSLLRIDRATFAYYRQFAPRLVDNLTRILAQRLRRTNEHVLALATLDVTGRVARQLLLLAEAYGRLEAYACRPIAATGAMPAGSTPCVPPPRHLENGGFAMEWVGITALCRREPADRGISWDLIRTVDSRGVTAVPQNSGCRSPGGRRLPER